MDLASLKSQNNKEKQRFTLEVGKEIAFIDYKIGKSGIVYLIHTEVPDALEGQGVGLKLVRESLALIEKEGLKIVPSCPFVRSFILEHRSAYENLLAEGVNL